MVCSTYLQELESYFIITCSSLSLLSSLAVLFSIIYRNLHKSLSFKILLYISFNDLIRSIGGFLESLSTSSIACSITGYFGSFSFISNLLWSTYLSQSIYQIIVSETSNPEKLHKIWFFFSFVFTGIVEAIPFLTQSYEKDQFICELAADFNGDIYRVVLIYLPLFLNLVMILYFTVKILRKVKLIKSLTMRSIVLERGFIYPCIIFVMALPLCFLRVLEALDKSCETGFAASMSYSVFILHGFINAIVFFNSRTVRKVLKNHEVEEEIGSVKSSLCISFESSLN